MSQQQRKQNLFGIQDWQDIYQNFRDADFKSYDYETIRKSMIDYLQLYHPENFNDYINSSEYVALIDVIAFMGQSLSFRMDLNARESFMETAKRRDNILRLARLVSYEGKRNLPSKGYLKVLSVSTDEVVRDVLNNNLSNAAIKWSDLNNPNWLEQWNTVLNAVISSSQKVGNPGNSAILDGIKTDEYSIDLPSGTGVPFGYSSTIQNRSMNFEAVNTTSLNQSFLYEQSPSNKSTFNLLFREDQQGYSSNNTGYFLFFKQGSLLFEKFSVTESLPNRIINLSSEGINNDDVWFFQINSNGSLTEWLKVDNVAGSNINYNSFAATQKNIFSVTSQIDDKASIIFGDGVFSNIPVGDFICYYRVSNGVNYRISPAEMNNINITIPYVSKTGRTQLLTVTASLKYTVANSATKENLDQIKLKAPQNYYTQNRMVNGQDYNSFPFSKYNNILKIKSVNRTSSGISRYLDVIDSTGRYSNTNIVADDGYIFKDDTVILNSFSFTSGNDIVNAINNQVVPSVASNSMLSFFYEYYSPVILNTNSISWKLVLADSNAGSGYLNNTSGTVISTTDSNFNDLFKVGAVIEFTAPTGKIFDYDNKLVPASSTILINQKQNIFATVRTITFSGTGNQSGNSGTNNDGTGAIVLSEKIPTGAILTTILPTFTSVIPSDIQFLLFTALSQKQNIGIGYKSGSTQSDKSGSWFIINNPTIPSTFIEPTDTLADNQQSWLMAFINSGNTYTTYQKSIKYFFGSEKQTRFFFDPRVKIFDPQSGKLLVDRIDVLQTNSQPVLNTNFGYSNDITLRVVNTVIENDGYVDDTKIQVSFSDKNSLGTPDQPYFYIDIVGTVMLAGVNNSYVFFKNDQANSGSTLLVQPKGTVKFADHAVDIDNDIYSYSNNDVIFTLDTNVFYIITRTGVVASKSVTTDYSYKFGRQNIKFQYRHNAPSDRRIDPSPSNIIDIYILDKNYADDYVKWLKDTSGQVTLPIEPTTESLRNDFSDLENYKMISDLMIFSPVTFKSLFGDKADSNLQANFLVVKNPNIVVSDSEVKSQVITQINNYFDVNNWDFGETFYFSELAAYLHSELNNIISSVHLVPLSTDQVYGDLQQIRCLPSEILISAATVLNVSVVTNLTTTQMRVGH